ncbi:MAG: L,D-transpeptidase family protein [Metallibacterium sp.]
MMRHAWIVLALLIGTCAHAQAPEIALPTAIATRLHTLAQQPLGALRIGDNTLGALVSRFYAQRADAPLWQSVPRVRALSDALNGLVDDGLAAQDYGGDRLTRDVLRLQHDASLTDAQRADIDVRATAAYLLALVQLRHGVLDVDAFYPDWNAAPPGSESDAWLLAAARAAESGAVTAAFAAARPAAPVYAQLRTALQRLRDEAVTGGWPALPAGPTLKPGMHDARVALLRRRLLASGDLTRMAENDADDYDAALADAVRTFQSRHGLQADGIVGAATRAALNVPVATRIEQLRLNLERARWYLHALPPRYVQVDLANYRLGYYDDGQLAWSTRVQVGQPRRPTPVLRSVITHLTLDPSWVVPPTILREDMLAKLRRDPNYLARNDLRVFDRQGQIVPAHSINWARPPSGLTLRQQPGPEGALGLVAFRFANTHEVYLHDTPHKALFTQTRRAFSSGCVRVENAMELAQLLLDDPVRWNAESLQTAASYDVTRDVPLDPPVPLHIIYWTVAVRNDGRVGVVPDVYHQDPALRDALSDALARQEQAFALAD